MRARNDRRDWVVKRRERTRHLIELGGLVVKSGLVDASGDDRAALYGGFVGLATRMRAEDGDQVLAQLRRRGKRAFENVS